MTRSYVGKARMERRKKPHMPVLTFRDMASMQQ